MKLLLSFLFLISLVACQEENGTKVKSLEFKSELTDITTLSIEELEEVENHLRNNRVFRHNTDQERRDIERSLKLMKASLLKIKRQPDAIEALRLLEYYARVFMSVKLVERDEGLLEKFKYSLNTTIARIARLNNIELDQNPWILFKSNFSTGLDQFVTFSTKGDWQTGWALDKSYIKVRGDGNKSWLIAPPMKMEGVRHIKLRLHQTLSIDRASRYDDPFDRSQIIQNAFKVMVSEDYVNGEPEGASWTEHKLSGFPIGSDFHARWSDELDLSQYEGKKISIALLYDMDSKKLGRHFVTWQINEFQLLGAGDTFQVSERPRVQKMYEHAFTQAKLNPFHSLSTQEVVEWAPGGFSGKINYVKVESDKPNVDTWLISPKIKLEAQENPTMILKEIVRAPKRSNLQVLISDEYDGADPKLTNWTVLEHIPTDFNPEDNKWVNFTSTEIDLSDFKNKTFTLAFRYIGDDNVYRGWEIESILIKGKGKSTISNQNITYQNPNATPEIAVSVNKEFSFYDLKDEWQARVIDGNPATFRPLERNGQKYLEVSGFKDKNTGTIQLETALIDIPSDKPVMQIVQSIRFYEPKDRGLNLIEVMISSDSGTTWKKIQITNYPGANDKGPVETEWVDMSAFAGQQVILGFKYKTEGASNIFPSWQLYSLKIGELK